MLFKLNKTYQYSIFNVANMFIKLAKADGLEELHIGKLMILCFIAYGRYLAKTNEKLFKEPIENSEFGPYVPKLYYAFLKNSTYYLANFIDTNYLFPTSTPKNITIKTIIYTWKDYRSYASSQLIELLNRKGTSLEHLITGEFGNIIPDDLIREYYITHFYKGEA